ncbi:CDP-diacylglycerol--glycerol-3-phosphate 3-phosphatidyltransferase, mitochondrial isoform X1 [Zerene cesonia]|uniref:CDP-diacylglycerol--glycerol-3-phosphate 3-phosphatidyltransferase, mitochondrial isoform X1 n=1 Tax=Zerene cesonia TaxID=33412 RepID=UPI0018E586E4|nr:CDP-diacylglycerol--glycerol-3-phosphate 3-phosphatidyltransferase, mitochondrial isoform X1 [Zerene cesonia]
MTLRFKLTELQPFNWIYNLAPCFPVTASKINIITNPKQFYNTLYDRFRSAKRRISIASLYIGTGELEKDLLGITVDNVKINPNLTFNVLLDYQRGTRGEINSRSLFKHFTNGLSNRCNLALYQTSRLQGSWSKALPSRYNEIVGLQHMKLYISDNSVILSGANCSNDYFKERQDRYIEIEDEDLANFYCDIIDEVTKFSKQERENNSVEKIRKDVMIKSLNYNIKKLITKWKEYQYAKISSSQEIKNQSDTWIFPLIQMGEFNINQDEEATCKIMETVPEGSHLRLATGYFNLTEKYAKILLKHCKANISLLMAHPNANGFMGAAGPAGGIPHAYSLIAREFWQQVTEYNQISRVQMLEYERPGWTFHAKGLWYYPSGSGVPWITVIGSANLGERSVRRDLEAQAAIFTSSADLQARLHDECSKLHEYASECSTDLQERQAPLWVRATVGLFRTYF